MSKVYRKVAYSPAATPSSPLLPPSPHNNNDGENDDIIAMHTQYTAKHPSNYLDLFIPTTTTTITPTSRLPVVVYVHGGGWQRGSRNAWFRGAPQFGKFCAANNVVCATVSYRLSRASWPSVFTKTLVHSAVLLLILQLLRFFNILSLPSSSSSSSSSPLLSSSMWMVISTVVLTMLAVNTARRLFKAPVEHPDHVEDVAAAVAWVRANVRTFCKDADPDNALFVAGHSAGGHLCSLVALHPRYLKEAGVPANAIKGVIAISGVYSMHGPWQRFNCLFRSLYTMSYSPDSSVWEDASPITHVTATAPPFLVYSAAFDCGLESDALRFVNKLQANGVEVDYHVVEKTGHGSIATKFDRLDASRHAIDFIQKHMATEQQ